MKNKKKSMDMFEIVNNNKTVMLVVGIIAVIALIFIGYGMFRPKVDLESSGKSITTTDLSKFPAYLSDFGRGEYLINKNHSTMSPFFFYKYATGSNGVAYSAICTTFMQAPPTSGTKCTLMKADGQWDDATSAAVGAIVAHSYVTGGVNGKISEANYYIGELAVNRYLCLLNNPNNESVCNTKNEKYVQSIDYNYLSTSDKAKIDTLVNVAKEARKKQSAALKPTLSSQSLTFTKSGDKWVSNTVTVSGSYIDSWDVVLSNAKATVIKNGNTFRVEIPTSAINNGSAVTVKATVKAKKSYRIAAKYDCGKGYQTVTPSYTINKELNADNSIEGTIGAMQLTISKKDSSTGKDLKGAKLVLTKPDGQSIEITTTDSEMVITDNLTYGTYTLKEKSAPNGYKLNTKTVTGVLDSTNLSLVLKMENDPTGVTISKTASDINGQLAGTRLQILDKDGKVAVKEWTTTTNKKTIKGLAAGTYYLQELSATSGYKKSIAQIEFVLESDGKVKINNKTESEVNLVNYPIEVTFSKTDIANSEELPGAQLQILDKDGKEIKDANGKVMYKWISTDEPHVISKIPAGKYYLVETQEPTGYVKKKEKIAFEIDEYGTITVNGKKVEKVMMTNEKTKVNISKQDVTNGKEIKGAELQVTNADGKVVDKWTSTDKPHMIEGLSVGKYYLTEKIAPKGYVVSEEKIEFTIKNDGTVDTVVMLNTPIVDVPNTASAASIIASIVGVIAVIFGGWMIYNNVRQRKA